MLEGHTAKVNSVSLSSDGSSMVSCSSDGTVRIWDVSTGEPRAVFTEQGVPVTSATFSPDGLRVAVGDLHGSICEWDISTGLKVARIPPDDSKIFGLAHYNSRDGASIHHEQSKILCLAYSRDGARIISCSKTKICFMDLATTQLLRVVHARDLGFVAVEIQTIAPDGSRVCLQDRSPFRVNTGLLQIWDIRGHADLVHRTDLGSSSYLARLEFSSDGHRAAFLTQERALELVNFDDGVHVVYSTLSPFQGHLGHVFAVSSTSAGSVAFGSLNNVLLLRDSSSSSPAAAQSLTTLGRHTTRVNCMAFSFDGARAVSGSEAGTVGIWETKVDVRGPGPSSLPASSSRALIDMTLQSQDGSRLICVFSNSLIEVYDTTSGTVLNALDLSLVLPRATYRSRTFWMAMSPNSLRLAFCVETESEDTEYLHIWDLEASRVLDCVDRVRYEDTYSESTPFTLGPSDANKTCCPLVWSPDGARCAMVIFGRKVHIWNAISGQMEAVWDLPKFPEITRTLPDGSASPEHEVVSNILHHVEFSRNGRQLLVIASTDNHALQCIWYSPTSTSHVSSAFYPKDIFPGHTISFGEGSAFSPDGTHLTSYSRKKKELYLRSIDTNPSRDNGEPRFIHDWHDTIEPVVWSCDGSQVALMISGTVLVWRVKMVAANPCVVLTFRYDMAEVYVKTIEELAPSLLIRRYQPLDCYFRPHRLLAFSTDGHRICVCSLKEEVHWRAGTDFQVPSLLRDDPAQRSLAVTDASVDIIASDHSGWLLCSRADRSKLVPLIWVPPQRRWKTARDVQVVGSKVTFQSASRQFVTILDFPSLQDLYRLSESDGVSDSQQPDPKPYTKIGSETDSKTGSDLPPGRASCHIDTVLRIQ
jgi:WD40 repeat protein